MVVDGLVVGTGRVRVAGEVFARHPDYRAVVVTARGVANGPSDAASRALLRAAEAAARDRFGDAPVTDHPHVRAWREAYAAFGAKPSRFRSSAEALVRRALGAGLPEVNRLVDAYNAVSVAHVVPVGGEDLGRVAGAATLRFAVGGEPFTTVEDGEAITVGADPGEAVWADEAGVTCRRWNWRQCARTALGDQVRDAYFLFDALGPLADPELDAAVGALAGHLARLSPGCAVEVATLRRPQEADATS